MILYLDTSALVKRYVRETSSLILVEGWNEADELATSAVAYAEAMSAFHHKRREAVTECSTVIQSVLPKKSGR